MKRNVLFIFSFHFYSQRYGHQNVKNVSYFVFSADGSKQLVTVWAKFLNPPKRSYSNSF